MCKLTSRTGPNMTYEQSRTTLHGKEQRKKYESNLPCHRPLILNWTSVHILSKSTPSSLLFALAILWKVTKQSGCRISWQDWRWEWKTSSALGFSWWEEEGFQCGYPEQDRCITQAASHDEREGGGIARECFFASRGGEPRVATPCWNVAWS